MDRQSICCAVLEAGLRWRFLKRNSVKMTFLVLGLGGEDKHRVPAVEELGIKGA
jgi:hypothetical protein